MLARRNSRALAILLLLLLAAHAQIINGCVRYSTNSYMQTRCIQCYAGMGLTTANTCQFCPDGQAVVGGVCRASTNTNSNGNSNPNSNVDANGGQTQQSSSGIFMFNIRPNVIQPSTPYTGQTVVVLSPAQPTPTPQAQAQAQPVPPVIVPLNCVQYSQITWRCSQCKQGYVLDGNAVCVQGKVQQNNNPINPSLSYDPNAIDTAPKPSAWATDTASSDFSNFGMDSGMNSGFQSDGLSETGSFASPQPQPQPPADPAPSAPAVQNNKPAASAKTATNVPVNTNTNTDSNSNNNSNSKSGSVVHKFPQYPFCFDYDGGQCWACVPGYLLNLILNQCVPYQKPATPDLSALANNDTQPAPVPPAATDNCDVFSAQENVCKECVRNYYLNKGAGVCQEVDQQCRTYDRDTGQCLTCYSKFTLKSGKCLPSR